MEKLLVINGPNLNMLGIREPGVYGTTGLEAISAELREYAAARGRRTRGETPMVSPLLRITPLPSGRAARVKVSDAFQLPPNCYCDRQGIGCHPRGVHLYPAGASPSREQ